jgi:hypothetical protein
MSLSLKASFQANAIPLFTSTIVASIPRKQKHRFFEPKKQDSTITLTFSGFPTIEYNKKNG